MSNIEHKFLSWNFFLLLKKISLEKSASFHFNYESKSISKV